MCKKKNNQNKRTFFFPTQSSRHSKLEKADILEMTVKHLRNLQRVQMSGTFLANIHERAKSIQRIKQPSDRL